MTVLARPAVALALLSLSFVAVAQEASVGWRWAETMGARMNPVGLVAGVELHHRHRLYEDPSPLLSSNHVQVGGELQLSPASVAPLVGVELQPLSVLTLRAAYAPVFFLGTSGMARSYPSPRIRLGGGAFRPVADGTGGAYALAVQRLLLGGSLQARVRAVGARVAVEAARVEAELHGDDRVFYDPEHDLLVHRRGWMAQGDLDLFWFAGDRLLLGARDTLVTAWYPADAFAGGDRGSLHERTLHRLGPFGRYRLFRGRGGTFDEGSVIVAAQWWLAHPDRAGRSSPAALPLVQVALLVSGGP